MEWYRLVGFILSSLLLVSVFFGFIFHSDIIDFFANRKKKLNLSNRRKGGNMPNKLEHERNRFSTMTRSQLKARLNRITTSDKLLNFSTVAKEFGYNGLSNEALSKLYKLTGYVVHVNSVNPDPKPKETSPLIRKIRL